MPYRMVFKVDGACRGNGYYHAVGAAAAVRIFRNGGHKAWTRDLNDEYDTPTSQRADLTALILALTLVLEKYDDLSGSPTLWVDIYSDSRYAVNCINVWMDKWENNGWYNSKGNRVANLDLLQELSDLHSRVSDIAVLDYHWISRDENVLADGYCKGRLDDLED